MKTKDLVEVSLLLAIGFVLHSLFPPILFGMKPDFSLAMLFAIILLKRDYKFGLLAGIATGVFTALTTGFPGGQVANIIDKLITSIVMSTLIIKFYKENIFFVGLINGIGTLLSGTIFLSTAALLFRLPGPMLALILTVVIPAAVINIFTGILLYKSIIESRKFLQQVG